MKPSPNPSASVAISSWEDKMRMYIWKRRMYIWKRRMYIGKMRMYIWKMRMCIWKRMRRSCPSI